MMMQRLLLLAASFSFVAGWKHLTEHDFQRAVGGHNQALIAFVEPSAIQSKALEAEWTSIANSEKEIGSIDCSAQAQLCKDYGITSYPTVRYFDGHGKITSYRGPRTASAVVSFLRRASRPPVTELNEKRITAFSSIDDAVIIAYINPRDQHVRAAFKSLASRYKDRASFGWLETADESTIVCYNNKDDEQSSTSDLTAIETLPSFIETCMNPLIGEFTRRNEIKYFESRKSLVYYFAKTRQERESFVDAIRPIAKKYREFLSFVTVDAREYASMAPMLGLRSKSFPALAVNNQAQGQVFPFVDDIITPDAVDNFVIDIAGGRVKPWSPVPVPEASHPHDEL